MLTLKTDCLLNLFEFFFFFSTFDTRRWPMYFSHGSANSLDNVRGGGAVAPIALLFRRPRLQLDHRRCRTIDVENAYEILTREDYASGRSVAITRRHRTRVGRVRGRNRCGTDAAERARTERRKHFRPRACLPERVSLAIGSRERKKRPDAVESFRSRYGPGAGIATGIALSAGRVRRSFRIRFRLLLLL
jgi:hypothetical protein